MTDHVINADAAGVFVALIPDGRRYRARGLDLAGDDPIDLARGLTGKDMLGHVIQNTRRQLTGLVHAGKVGCLVDADAVLGQAAVVLVVQRGSPITPTA